MPALVHPPDRVGELVERRDAVLQEVADAAVAPREQLPSVDALDVLAENQDADIGQLRAQAQRGPDSLVAEVGREPDVEDRDIRHNALNAGDDVVGIAERAGGDIAGLVEEAHQTLAEQQRVLDEHDPQGMPGRRHAPG